MPKTINLTVTVEDIVILDRIFTLSSSEEAEGLIECLSYLIKTFNTGKVEKGSLEK
jgi:hypothetical protein